MVVARLTLPASARQQLAAQTCFEGGSRRAANQDSTSADPLPILKHMVLMPYHHMFEFGAIAVLALILIARILMR